MTITVLIPADAAMAARLRAIAAALVLTGKEQQR